MKNYDKFSYSHQRNRSAPEESSYAPPSTNSKNPSNHPSTSVLSQLRHGAYRFAIAEDGILHSRIVAPPRICYAPVISELDAPNLPQTPWSRLKKILLLNPKTDAGENDEDNNEEIGMAASSSSMPPKIQKILKGLDEIDYETFGYFEWDHVDAALSALEQEDTERDESLAGLVNEAIAEQTNHQISEEDFSQKLSFYKDKRSTFDSERVSAIDRAKIELIWKKARMLLVEKKNEDQVEEEAQNEIKMKEERRQRKIERDRAATLELMKTSTSFERVSSSGNVSNNNSRASSSKNLSRENSMSATSSSVPVSGRAAANALFGARGTIFNEKLKWTNKPRVNSNNASLRF